MKATMPSELQDDDLMVDSDESDDVPSGLDDVSSADEEGDGEEASEDEPSDVGRDDEDDGDERDPQKSDGEQGKVDTYC